MTENEYKELQQKLNKIFGTNMDYPDLENVSSNLLSAWENMAKNPEHTKNMFENIFNYIKELDRESSKDDFENFLKK